MSAGRAQRAGFGGGKVLLRGLGAADELRRERCARENLRLLEALELAGEEAEALAANAACVWAGVGADPPYRSGWEVLERLSAGEIADLARLWQEWDDGSLELGSVEDEP